MNGFLLAGNLASWRTIVQRQNACASRAGLNVVGHTFRRIAAFFLGTQFLFGLMPKFIFPAFRPAVALPDLICAIEDLFFRGAFHLVLLAGTTSARRGQGPVRTNAVQARLSLLARWTNSDMLGRFPYTSACKSLVADKRFGVRPVCYGSATSYLAFLQLEPRSPGPRGAGLRCFADRCYVLTVSQDAARQTWMAGTKPGRPGKRIILKRAGHLKCKGRNRCDRLSPTCLSLFSGCHVRISRRRAEQRLLQLVEAFRKSGPFAGE